MGWQYDSRTALFDSEPDDHGSVAAAGFPATGALDVNGRYSRDAVPARGHLRGAGGCDAAAQRGRRVLVPGGRDNRWALLAGWTHYLAFDLFIGGWEVRDAQRRGIPHLLIVPALVLTFLLGPAGLLFYLAIRWFAPDKGAPTSPAATVASQSVNRIGTQS
jgi:hypothetical protein